MATANPAMSEAVYRRAGLAAMRHPGNDHPGIGSEDGDPGGDLVGRRRRTPGHRPWTASTRSPTACSSAVRSAGFIMALVTIFMPKVSPFTAPIYAALEGLVLGAISAVFETVYPGIVIQAVGLSIGVLAVMLFVYGTGIIRATEKFKIGVVAATGAICLVYLVDIVVSLFGITHAVHPRGGAGGHRFLPGRRRHRGVEPDSGLRLHRAGSQSSRHPSTWNGTAGSACWSR